jgi:hypothetical protein
LADQLKKDKAELERILKERKKQEAEEAKWNKKIQIRSDEFEVNKDFVRYNSVKIPADEITGLKFGIFRQIVNGIASSSYLIDIRGRGTSISTECKRVFRSEDQAQADFTAILEAVLHQLIPGFVIKLAELITSGKGTVQIGSLLLTQHGVQCETGSLWWKKQHTVPFTAWTFFDQQGHVHASAKQPEPISFSLDRRAVWNAVIVEKLVEIIKLIQSQAKK